MTGAAPVLGGAAYGPRAQDLARWFPEPADDAVASVVAAMRSLDVGAVARLRDRMTVDETYVLITFARRSAARALRDSDSGAARLAVDAVTLVDRSRIDVRDLSIDLPLLAVKETGHDVVGVLDAAVSRSAPDTAGALSAARARIGLLTVDRCSLLRVTTRHGVGFVDVWARSSTPPTRLAEAMVVFADDIEAEGTYVVGGVRTSDFPGVWFGDATTPSDRRTLGCVACSADHIRANGPWSHGLLVFLAEMGTVAEAMDLAAAANASSVPDRPRTAVAAGRFLAVLIGGSGTMGEAALETAETMHRFGPLAHTALAHI